MSNAANFNYISRIWTFAIDVVHKNTAGGILNEESPLQCRVSGGNNSFHRDRKGMRGTFRRKRNHIGSIGQQLALCLRLACSRRRPQSEYDTESKFKSEQDR